MVTEPKTEAGKRLLDYLNNGMDDGEALAVAVADIEAEAVNAALDKVLRAVEKATPEDSQYLDVNRAIEAARPK